MPDLKMAARPRAELPSCRKAWHSGRAHAGHSARSAAAAAAARMSESRAGKVKRTLRMFTGLIRWTAMSVHRWETRESDLFRNGFD